jgi:hypothetical protein
LRNSGRNLSKGAAELQQFKGEIALIVMRMHYFLNIWNLSYMYVVEISTPKPQITLYYIIKMGYTSVAFQKKSTQAFHIQELFIIIQIITIEVFGSPRHLNPIPKPSLHLRHACKPNSLPLQSLLEDYTSSVLPPPP